MNYLYLDIETVPDDSRKELWGLPEPVELPDPEELVTGNANDVAGWLKANALSIVSDDWLTAVAKAELKGKGRSTVLAAVEAAGQAESNLTKELSLDPERCRIVAIGWALDDGKPMAIGDAPGRSEATNLESFWHMTSHRANLTLVGFNILGFDLPVICARSILLGVKPTVQIDWRKYGNPQVIDLMLCRFPYGKAKSLKLLAEQYGIDVPAPDVDGSMVHQMSPDEIAEYVKSDIVVTRELHKRFAGFFCPPIYEDEELF